MTTTLEERRTREKILDVRESRRMASPLEMRTDALSGHIILEGYASTFQQFERLVGLARLKVFHVNDSKRPLGSRVDRHEHIGRGFVGLGAFRRLLNDPRFRDLPMLLETPKTEGRSPTVIQVDPLDRRNLTVLRRLIERSSRARGRSPAARRRRGWRAT